MIRVFVLALAALVLPVGLAACTENKTPAHRTPSATQSPSQSASPTPAPESITDPFEAAVAAYLRFRDVLDEAAAIPDPNYAGLEDVAADEGLEVARQGLQRLADEGLQNTGKHTDEFEVKDWAPEDNPTQIALVTCSDSSQTLVVNAETGEPAEGEEYGKRHVEALVELRDGRWLVTDLVFREIGTC
jgi:hypothetical protein